MNFKNIDEEILGTELFEHLITEENFNESAKDLYNMYQKPIVNLTMVDYCYGLYEYTNCIVCRNLKLKKVKEGSEYYCEFSDCKSSNYACEKLLECIFMPQLTDARSEFLKMKQINEI